MASTDATPLPLKNTAFRVTFPILDNTGALVSGATALDSEVSKDAGSYADCTNEATEIGSSGTYYLDLTSTEMNADTVTVIVNTSTVNARPTVLVIYPSSAGKVKVDVQTVATQTASAAGAVTFPGTIASTTNITAGTITTATNLTNAPSAGDFTATMKTSLNAATPVVTVSDKTGFSLANGSIASATFAIAPGLTGGLLIAGSNAATTFVSISTGSLNISGVPMVSQTGDSFARIGVTGSGLTSLATTAQAVKLLAAVYDSATLSGSTLTLSNGATMVVGTTGRTTT